MYVEHSARVIVGNVAEAGTMVNRARVWPIKSSHVTADYVMKLAADSRSFVFGQLFICAR